MRDPLTKKVVDIAPSGIRKFFDIVSEMDNVISLGVGDLSEYFGFTEQEVKSLCDEYHMSFQEAKAWYE